MILQPVLPTMTLTKLSELKSMISAKDERYLEAMGDSSLSDEQKEAKQKEGARLEEEYDKVIKEGVQKTSPTR